MNFSYYVLLFILVSWDVNFFIIKECPQKGGLRRRVGEVSGGGGVNGCILALYAKNKSVQIL